jgi:hypothetical protein
VPLLNGTSSLSCQISVILTQVCQKKPFVKVGSNLEFESNGASPLMGIQKKIQKLKPL